MIQIVFTDNGKVHTVTFSGDDAKYWSFKFKETLWQAGIEYEMKNLAIA